MGRMQREWLRSVGVAGVAGLCGCSSTDEIQPSESGSDPSPDEPAGETTTETDTDTVSNPQIGGWPTFRHDHANTSHVLNVRVTTSDVTQQRVFGTNSSIGRCSPPVVNGTVYIGSNDDNLYAVTEQ